MRDLLNILAATTDLKTRNEPATLATVVAVEGSSYRLPGARMLIDSTGRRCKCGNYGCLEAYASGPAIAERAREALTPRPDGSGPTPRVRIAPPQLAPGVSQRLAEAQDEPNQVHSFAVVPVAVLDLAALHALAYAVSLGQPVLAVHISPTDEEAKRFRQAWTAWGDHLPLELVVSPYRATVAPLANYIAALHNQRPDVTLTLVVPEIVVARGWQRILHNRISMRLRAALIAYDGIVITIVPFHLPT